MKFTGLLGSPHTRFLLGPVCTALVCLALTAPAGAQTCAAANEMDPATRSALQQAGQQFFQMAARGDMVGMQAQSVPSLASSFSAVATAVNDHKANLTGAQTTVRNVYQLEAPGTAPLPKAEFYCGVWGTPDFTGFGISNLPPGRYAIVLDDIKGGKAPLTMLLVLKDEGGWKLAGFYTKLAQIAGHDSAWYLDQARQFKAKGQTHNAWFYYLESIDLLKPVPFMSTRQMDQVFSEAETTKPADMPPGAPLAITAGGKTLTVTQMTVLPAPDGLDLVAKYQSPDISNTLQTYNDNLALAKALVQRYPEFRPAFVGIWVTALGPGGNQYSTPVLMKDIK